MANFEQLAIGGLDYYSETEPTGAKSEELWLQYSGTYEKNYDATQSTNITELWNHNSFHENSVNEVSHSNGVVFSGSSHVVAVNDSDGSKIWQKDNLLNGNEIYCLDAFSDLVYVGGSHNTAYALDPSDGSTLWTHSSGVIKGSGEYNGYLYSFDYDGYLYKIDKSDGTILSKDNFSVQAVSDISITNGRLFIAGYDKITAVNLDDLSIVWTHTLHGSDDPTCIHSNKNIVSSGGSPGKLRVAQFSDGAEVCRSDYLSSEITDLVIENGSIVTVDKNNNAKIAMFDSSTGNLIWEYTSSVGYLYGTDAYNGNIYIAGQSWYVWKYDLDGISDSDITETITDVTNGDLHINYNGTWAPHQ